jgi:tetratricopeptide (TPR) repeat protein
MTGLTRKYGLVILSLTAILAMMVVGLRSATLLGFMWANTGFLQFNHTLSQDVSNSSIFSHAIAALRKATNYYPNNDSAWRALGYAAYYSGDETAAVRAWKHAPLIVNELIDKGLEAQRAGHKEAALPWFELVTRIAPDLADGWFLLALAYEDAGDWSSAADFYATAVSRPTSERVGYSDLNFRLGRARWQAGEDEELALAALDQALQADDFSGDWAREQSHYVRGVVLRQAGRGREAATEFAWVVAHAPDNYWAHVQLGLLAWEVDEDVATAEKWLQKAIPLAANNKWVYRHLGQIYKSSGQLDRAAAMYQTVLSLDPNDEIAAAFLSNNANQE